jgi:hypothetical protein
MCIFSSGWYRALTKHAEPTVCLVSRSHQACGTDCVVGIALSPSKRDRQCGWYRALTKHADPKVWLISRSHQACGTDDVVGITLSPRYLTEEDGVRHNVGYLIKILFFFRAPKSISYYLLLYVPGCDIIAVNTWRHLHANRWMPMSTSVSMSMYNVHVMKMNMI